MGGWRTVVGWLGEKDNLPGNKDCASLEIKYRKPKRRERGGERVEKILCQGAPACVFAKTSPSLVVGARPRTYCTKGGKEGAVEGDGGPEGALLGVSLLHS